MLPEVPSRGYQTRHVVGHRAKIMVVVYQMDLDADNFGFSDRPFTCCSFHLFTAAIMPLVRNYT